MLTKPRPPADPYDTRRLDVGAGHSIYVEQYGNPQGAPAIVLHGGPGSGCQPGQRQWFDPNLFRVVLFDQRGAGRSTPAGSLAENTTWDLVADMEVIRAKFGNFPVDGSGRDRGGSRSAWPMPNATQTRCPAWCCGRCFWERRKKFGGPSSMAPKLPGRIFGMPSFPPCRNQAAEILWHI